MSGTNEQGTSRRRRYVVAAGAVVSGITLASAGAAAAAGGTASSGHSMAGVKPVAVAFVRGQAKPAKTDPDQKALNAYFKAGYDWNDALRLAKLWHVSAFTAKVKAGDKLLAGDKLPIKHRGGGSDGQTAYQAREVDAFFTAGYDYADAVKLGRLWHTSDPYHAKLRAGGKLLHGISLPFPPH